MLYACLPVGRRSALPVLRSPARRGEGWMREVGAMPAIAPIEDLKAAQKGFTLCSFTDTRHETRSRY